MKTCHLSTLSLHVTTTAATESNAQLSVGACLASFLYYLYSLQPTVFDCELICFIDNLHIY